MKIPATPLAAIIATAAMAFSLPCQVNLVVNGDFETGSISPWVESGWSCASTVSQHNCAGAGASQTFNCILGGKSGQTRRPNGYWPGNAIEQDVLVVQTVEYLFMADVQIQNMQSPATGNADAGLVEVFVDGVSVGSHNFGRYTGNTWPRARMCFTFTATTTGLKKLLIDFSRRYYCSTRTPTCFIDNIVLVQGPMRPLVCPLGERYLNATANISIDGTPSSNFALFLGLGQMPSGFPIPGFNGAWWLTGPFFQLFVQQFDANGHYGFQPAIPNDPTIDGLLLYWQAIEAPSGVNIGEVTSFAFYK